MLLRMLDRMLWRVLFFGTTTVFLLLATTNFSHACNEAVCASVVSKCMLTQSCKCDLVTCTCCKECFSCLSYLYNECCSCVGEIEIDDAWANVISNFNVGFPCRAEPRKDLCPKPNVTTNPLSKKSHVEDFSEPVPGLFQALTTEPDPQERWLTFSYPVDFDMSQFIPKHEKEMKYQMQTAEQEVHPLKPNVMTVNCTVAFMAQCNSYNKCKASCQSMGATSYRWFHDGCCECIGDTCINYGINESRCIHCPLDKEMEDDLRDQYDDYGQDEDDLGEEDLD